MRSVSWHVKPQNVVTSAPVSPKKNSFRLKCSILSVTTLTRGLDIGSERDVPNEATRDPIFQQRPCDVPCCRSSAKFLPEYQSFVLPTITRRSSCARRGLHCHFPDTCRPCRYVQWPGTQRDIVFAVIPRIQTRATNALAGASLRPLWRACCCRMDQVLLIECRAAMLSGMRRLLRANKPEYHSLATHLIRCVRVPTHV